MTRFSLVNCQITWFYLASSHDSTLASTDSRLLSEWTLYQPPISDSKDAVDTGRHVWWMGMKMELMG